MYKRYLVADGNFVLNHAMQKRGQEEAIWLTDGAGFMARKSDYDEFIKMTKEPRQVRCTVRPSKLSQCLLSYFESSWI